MAKMWEGVTSGQTSRIADDFNSSISVDCRMYEEDIKGSIAHAKMLAKCGIIGEDEAEKLKDGLCGILDDIKEGKLHIDPLAEDIHMFVEEVLTSRIGEVGKKLHTARSRNDQVALDFRMYLRRENRNISELLEKLILTICGKADEYKDFIMPGYTHLQRAQPVTFGHHLMAYAMMFDRDISRLSDAEKRINVSPIGSCALAGTTYGTDRGFEADELGFDSFCLNSMDGVSDRDFAIETASDLSLVMMHLSRFSEELVLFSSWEYGFVKLSDSFTTGSSIMPQKKNPDMAELVRGKTGRVYGDLVTILTLMKGLPLSYNKDMQEDKECLFDAVDSVKSCLEVYIPMTGEMKADREAMLNAAKKGFINATDLADYLTKRGVPFRDAYKTSGKIVAECMEKGYVLDTLPLEIYKKYSDVFESDLYSEIALENCVEKRISDGGTSVGSVGHQIEVIRAKYEKK